MSEYQYYEFRAVDRPLTKREQAELRALSTRAEISAYHFSNHYEWGSFKGSPDEMMERYFDAHLYVTNWGVRRLVLRLPARRFDVKRAEPYVAGECPSLRRAGDHVILDFELEEAWTDDLIQGKGWLASLLPLREELLAGDFRALYLGWLAQAALGLLSAEEEEPPVPAGLGSLSSALTALADFLLIPPELLEIAARASAAQEPMPREELETWVRALPSPEKDALLLRLIDKAGATPELQRRRRSEAGQAQAAEKAAPPRRRVGTLLRDAVALQRDKERQEQERQAADREKELEALAARGAAAWEQVDQLFSTRRPTDHAAGVQLLVNLRDVAKRKGTEAEFIRRLLQLRERNARRAGLISRMDKEGLSAP